jgi:hypothetical protein
MTKKKQEDDTVPIKGLTTLACFAEGYNVELRKGYILRVSRQIADMLVGRGYAVRTDVDDFVEGRSVDLSERVGDKVLETRLSIAQAQWKGRFDPEKYLTLYPNGPKANAARNIISLEAEVARKTQA